MGLILAGALMGAGQFGQQLQRQWGAEELEKMREDAATARQNALIAAQQSMQQARFSHAKKMEEDVRQPFAKSEREAGETFKIKESELERTSRENMQIDRLALEEVLGHERNAIESKRVGIAGAQLKNDTERLNLEKQVKEIQIKATNLDLKDKTRFDTLKTKYLDPSTSDKDRAGIVDSMYALLGKDKYTAVVGKDEYGNPQFVGAFDTRSGVLKRPGAPYSDGTELRGKDGKTYVVRDGQPVLKAAPPDKKPTKNPTKEPAASTPEYEPPAGSQAAKAVATRRGIINARESSESEAAAAAVAVQDAFNLDQRKMTPEQLAEKYSGSPEYDSLTAQQKAVIFKARNQGR